MTFQSGHKFLAILLSGFICFAGTALAQQDPPPEEIEKIKAAEERRQFELEGKTDAPIVVELFTTSDCTACVFADRMLYDTMNEKNVIALSCHIKDLSELRGHDEKWTGAEESTKYKGPMDPCVFRQWSYRSNKAADAMLEIPMFIINGQDQIEGETPEVYRRVLNTYGYSHINKTNDVFMKWEDADTISVHLPQKNEKSYITSASVWIIRYKDIEVEKIESGINKGRVLRFSNIIQSIKHIGKWHGQPRTINVDVEKPRGGKERGGYAVLVQEMMGEPVLAAGRLVDYPVAADKKPVTSTDQRTAQ